MHVETSHHIDSSDPDVDGRYEWRYEYDLFRFSAEAITLVARSYVGEPTAVHFLRKEVDGQMQSIQSEDFFSTLFRQALSFLRAAGKTEIAWLTETGYEALPPDA